MPDEEKVKKKSKKDKDKTKTKSAAETKEKRSKSKERPKSSKSKKAKDEGAAPSTDAAMGSAAPYTGQSALLFERFDGGHKGYLSQADFAKAVQEMSHMPPTVGPYAAGSGASLYGAPLPSPLFSGRPSPLPSPLPSVPLSSLLGPLGSGPLGPRGALGGLGAQGGEGGREAEGSAALMQAYQTRVAALSSVAATLLGKRETLMHQLNKLQARAGEVSAARTLIENETLADAEAILHKLRSTEAAKLSILQGDIDGLSSDVVAIDNFYRALQNYQPSHGLPSTAPSTASPYNARTAIEFMRVYPELCAEADRLAAKAVKADVDVRADDFEREVAKRLEVVARYDSLMELVGAKDRIILQMLKDREVVTQERDISVAHADKLEAENNRLKLEMANLKLEKERLQSTNLSLQHVKKSNRSRGVDMDASDVPHDTEEWIKLTEELTNELNEVTDRLIRLQAFSGITYDPINATEGASTMKSRSALAQPSSLAASARLAGRETHTTRNATTIVGEGSVRARAVEPVAPAYTPGTSASHRAQMDAYVGSTAAGDTTHPFSGTDGAVTADVHR